MLASIRHEIRVQIAVTGDGVNATVMQYFILVCGLLCGIFLAYPEERQHFTAQALIGLLLKLTIHSYLGLCTFEYLNQIYGVEEDKINKPHRPIPSGLLTLKESQIRHCVFVSVYLAVGYCFDVLLYSMAFACVSSSYFFLRLHTHWFTKNEVFITLGMYNIYCICFSFADIGKTGVLANNCVLQRAAVIGAVFIGNVINVQDFRDSKGDVLIHRKTLPIVYGDRNARGIALLIGLINYLGIVLATVYLSSTCFFQASLVVVMVGAWMTWLHLRLWNNRVEQSSKHDNVTYRLFMLFYILSFALVCFVLVVSRCNEPKLC